MVDNNTKRFLIVVSLGSTEPSRLVDLVPSLQKVLQSLSTETPEQAFRSATADIFGYFIRSRLTARQITSAIESPGRVSVQLEEAYAQDIHPFLDNKDGVLAIEIGKDFSAGVGFTRVGTWLQHH